MGRSVVGQFAGHWAIAGVGALFATASLSEARAANCAAGGGLIFVGKTADNSNSVWLSGTSSGAFRLDAQGATKDSWNQARRGLHLTLSDVVSTGNGGTHHLYDNSGGGCLLDSQNQKGGVNLPPIGRLFPDFLTPEVPTVVDPPVAIKPPIGILPPQTITPEIPIAVIPPIGILPPTGITPEVPIAVKPPIGILPPDLITPELPIGVTPPIGTLPPTGITPELPIDTKPPIGVLPPEPITPELPIGVTPPIGTLPPTGITPELPIGTKPPIGVLPPEPITPEVPAITPPSPNVPETVANAQLSKRPDAYLADSTCAILEGNGYLYLDESGAIFTAPCTLVRQGGYEGITVASLLEQSDVPLTPGRDFIREPLWNFWSETRGFYAQDRRHNLDTEGYSGSFLFGVDREIAEDTVAGISASFETSGSDGYDGGLETAAYGFSVGPYFAHRLSPQWAVQGSLGYMLLQNDLEVVVLEGNYFSHQLSAAAAINGQYRYEEWILRPRFGLSYAETFVEDYDLSGTINTTPVTVNIGSDHFGYGSAEISGEASRYVDLGDDLLGMPYGELGLHIALDRPNDGKILSGDLRLEDTSPLTGTIRGGMRFFYEDRIAFDVGAGYLSIGQNGLDIWEAKARVSFAF
ncbi:autotransporter outer membrane beta-barrel domain-containing protein [Thalassospira profundimaris]|uniref:autotransporter outer membrane beta-barrel domain-containing protein n=1 Tax=Thalassospira profundimaris TaxID=502049 RepID=UPI000287227B|nr:autotransporter outer membrane beta-barrel domain-containing protein [Thalassospira profundimaris]EKF08454.1 outer membrane autotransporter [Thalassospira profundimaris WP0211]